MLSHSAWPHRVSPSVTQMITNVTATQSEESGIEPGHIATITGSLVSFTGHDPDHYDTDHTDLASEPDESEVKRDLLRDQWRQFFDRYDPEGFGEIPWPEFVEALSQTEFRQRIGSGKREVFLEKARTATTSAITFQDFVNVALPLVVDPLAEVQAAISLTSQQLTLRANALGTTFKNTVTLHRNTVAATKVQLQTEINNLKANVALASPACQLQVSLEMASLPTSLAQLDLCGQAEIADVSAQLSLLRSIGTTLRNIIPTCRLSLDVVACATTSLEAVQSDIDARAESANQSLLALIQATCVQDVTQSVRDAAAAVSTKLQECSSASTV